MKQLIKKLKSLFIKEKEITNPAEKKLAEKVAQSKDLLDRIENKDKEGKSTSNDIYIFDKEKQKVVGITGEKKEVILKKVQTELAKNPKLFVDNEDVKTPEPEPLLEKPKPTPKKKYSSKNKKPKKL